MNTRSAGQGGRGLLGCIFYFVDQIDMLLGVWLVLSLAGGRPSTTT